MEPTDNTGKAGPPTRAPDRTHGAAAAVAADVAGDHPFGPHAAQILASEHWSLLAGRSLIWNEALSRATVFLTVLSASIIALALLADATGFGPHTIMLALVLLPVVLLLGIATYVRQVQINDEEFQLVLAMNRLRHAYVATVDAAVAAAIAVLVLQTAEAPRAAVVAGGVVAFVAVWGGLMLLQRHSADPLHDKTPRFPTPPVIP
jgi:hypothetical protein